MPLNHAASYLLDLPRSIKRVVVVIIDASFCYLAVWLAFALRLEMWLPFNGAIFFASVVSVAIALPLFAVFGLYRAIYRYAGIDALYAIFKSLAIYAGIYFSIFTLMGVVGSVPRTIGFIQPTLLAIFVLISRLSARYWLGGLYRRISRVDARRLLIYGAGSAGRQLASALANSSELRPLGYLDDDTQLHGQTLNGLRIYNPRCLDELVKNLNIHDVLLAIPSASRARRNEVLELTRKAHVQVRTMPGLAELAQGDVQVSDLKELEIEDLLGREPVFPDPSLLAKNIAGKVVLVTGAGGSIGSELCRQIMKVQPAKLLLVEASEFALYAIHQELEKSLTQAAALNSLVPLLANVQDEQRMADIMAVWRPDTVYHAAAYKHVPLVEQNPVQGIKNNALGTRIVAQLAMKYGVSDFVLISTDKAVRPTNIMGASKRLAEMVLQAMAELNVQQFGKTRFSMVRFGNVLGSSGSVVPLFRRLIKEGGPITVTHPDVTRYFMTIPEAAELVIQAGAMADGGDVFVLDMGESVKIIDLARRMIELSGLCVKDASTPDGDIAIEVTGLRPGEKLYEELLIGDNPMPTVHPRVMKAHEDFLPWEQLQAKFLELEAALEKNDVPLVRMQLKELVPGYQSESEVVDWVYLTLRSKFDEVKN
jgi:FlaA1/EpsC-like NDP-sugar epimerase